MAPQTPVKGHSRHISAVSTPNTPDSGYFLADEGPSTPHASSHPFRPDANATPKISTTLFDVDKHTEAREFELEHDEDEDGVDLDPPSESSGRSFGSYNGESVLEMLDEEEGSENEAGDGDEDVEEGAGQPLVSRSKRRGRRRWVEEEQQERSLVEVCGHSYVIFSL
jgi:hypothetical protein